MPRVQATAAVVRRKPESHKIYRLATSPLPIMNTIQIPAGRSLDPYFHLHRDPTCFVLEAGEYTTQGAWGFDGNLDVCMLPPGSILRGTGSNATMIRFNQPTTRPGTGYFEALTGGSRSGSSTSLVMEGFTIDVSASPMPIQRARHHGRAQRGTDHRLRFE